jgi:hypothetical protein
VGLSGAEIPTQDGHDAGIGPVVRVAPNW